MQRGYCCFRLRFSWKQQIKNHLRSQTWRRSLPKKRNLYRYCRIKERWTQCLQQKERWTWCLKRRRSCWIWIKSQRTRRSYCYHLWMQKTFHRKPLSPSWRRSLRLKDQQGSPISQIECLRCLITLKAFLNCRQESLKIHPQKIMGFILQGSCHYCHQSWIISWLRCCRKNCNPLWRTLS